MSTSLQLLREKINALSGTHSRDVYPSSRLSLGVPQGALIELAGPQKLEWLCEFFKENSSLNVFWAEPTFTLLPTALQQRGVNLDHFLFAETGACSNGQADEALFKPIRKALRGQVFECIVAPSLFEEEKTLKALQLLSEKANATMFLLSPSSSHSSPRSAPWPISVQLKISRGPSTENPFAIEILKYKTRGGLTA
jgi:hypothetical protein